MTTQVASPAVFTDMKGLAELKRDAKAEDPQALREAARQFESLFARMMIQSMRQASFGDPLLGSDQQDFYQGMFDDQFAMEMTKGRGLGLADMLVQQLARAGLAPMEPKSLLNPYAPANSTTPSEALAMVDKLEAAQSTAATPPPTWQPGEPADFVRRLSPMAEAAGRELGIDPRHILAQAALETGWGRAVPSNMEGQSSFNFFGVKAGKQWSGATVTVRTLEFENGIPVPRLERFRAYESPQAGFRDYVALLRDNPRYAAALNTGGDAHAFANGLKRGGYATDPAYARKISAIAQNLAKSNNVLKSADARPITARTDPL